jgi:complex III assembly factor LYRM7
MARVITRTEVLSAYRYLLRSMTIAFQGDITTLSAARKEARSRFDTGRKLAAESPEALEGVTEARNVGGFLRKNLVQGVKDDKDDVYRFSPPWICNNSQDYEYTTKLSGEIMPQLRTRLQCHYRNGNLDGEGLICHSICIIKSNGMSYKTFGKSKRCTIAFNRNFKSILYR